jgi:hypothetical protein
MLNLHQLSDLLLLCICGGKNILGHDEAALATPREQIMEFSSSKARVAEWLQLLKCRGIGWTQDMATAQEPHPKLTTFIPKGLTTSRRLTHQMLLTSGLLLCSYLRSTGQASDALGQVCVTLQHPPTIWIPIYVRLGTRRLGTVILCILFVVWPIQGSLEHSLWSSHG